METIKTPQGIHIRLTDERWAHITEEHSELAGMRYEILEGINKPDRIYNGENGELFAVKEIGSGKFLVVVYKETGSDGFIITAFMTRRTRSLEKRTIVWSALK